MRNMIAGERGVPDPAIGRRRDAVSAAALGRCPGLDLAGLGIDAAVDAALAGEPDHAILAEYRGVEIGAGERRRQRVQLNLLGLGVDPRDRVLAALGESGVAVGPDDHAVRRGAVAERNLLELAGLRIEASGEALLLAAEPDRAVGCRRDVVRVGAGG